MKENTQYLNCKEDFTDKSGILLDLKRQKNLGTERREKHYGRRNGIRNARVHRGKSQYGCKEPLTTQCA